MKRALIVAAVALGSLLGLTAGAQADLRVSSNFRLSSDGNAFRAKDSLGMAADPNNANHVVATMCNYLSESLEATTSTDGGITWSPAVSLLAPTGGSAPGVNDPFQPTCRIGNHLAEHSFQTVKFGSGQNVYATSVDPRACPTGGCPANTSGTGAAATEQGASILVYRSTDGGQNWAPGVVAAPGGLSANNGPYHELPTLAVDPGAAGGADRVIAAARETTVGDAKVAVSNDGGQSFPTVTRANQTAGDVSGPDSTSQPVIGSDHSVGISWRSKGVSASVRFARATDGAAPTFGAPVDVTGVTAGGRGAGHCTTIPGGQTAADPTTVPAPPPPGATTECSHVVPRPSAGSTFPRLAIDQARGNKLYIVYNQEGPPTNTTFPTGSGPYNGADHFIGPDTDVWFQRSLDNGTTWSTPKLINDASAKPGTPITQTRHPDVAVAPNGRVDIVWQDRRHWFMEGGTTQTEHDCVHTHFACEDARLGDTYYAFSTNSGSSFSPNGGKRITDRSINNDVGQDYRFGSYWAYGPQAVELGSSQMLIGWMDSREGSFDNGNHDIYLARVDHSASSTVPQENLARSADAPTFSVGLSQRSFPGGPEGTLASTFAVKDSTRPVIVNEAEVGKVLAGGVLARANLGPVLLSPASGLPASVKAEVGRLNPAGAYVIGDTSSLSGQVETDLQNAGVPGGQVVRLGGPGANDAAVAKAIADAMDRRTTGAPSPACGATCQANAGASEKTSGVPAFDAAVIVNPTSPDASTVAGLAAARRLPVLFTNPNGSIATETTAALGELNINKTLLIGSSSVVNDDAGYPNPTRLGGANQYETSKAVVNESRDRGLPENIVYVADGNTPLDGALLGATVGRATGLELLAPAALASNAPTALSDLNLTSQVDRMVLVQPVASGGGDTGSGSNSSGMTTQGTTAGDKSAPGVSNYGLTNNPFRVGGATPLFGNAAAKKTKKHKKGTMFRYTLSEAATVRITIAQARAGRRKGKRCVAPSRKLRKAKKCTRTVNRGTLTRTSHAGANKVAFSGRIGSKKLSPGRYLATLVATDAAKNSSTPKTITFTVVKR